MVAHPGGVEPDPIFQEEKPDPIREKNPGFNRQEKTPDAAVKKKLNPGHGSDPQNNTRNRPDPGLCTGVMFLYLFCCVK